MKRTLVLCLILVIAADSLADRLSEESHLQASPSGRMLVKKKKDDNKKGASKKDNGNKGGDKKQAQKGKGDKKKGNNKKDNDNKKSNNKKDNDNKKGNNKKGRNNKDNNKKGRNNKDNNKKGNNKKGNNKKGNNKKGGSTPEKCAAAHKKLSEMPFDTESFNSEDKMKGFNNLKKEFYKVVRKDCAKVKKEAMAEYYKTSDPSGAECGTQVEEIQEKFRAIAKDKKSKGADVDFDSFSTAVQKMKAVCGGESTGGETSDEVNNESDQEVSEDAGQETGEEPGDEASEETGDEAGEETGDEEELIF